MALVKAAIGRQTKESLVRIYQEAYIWVVPTTTVKTSSPKSSSSSEALIRIYECFCDETRLRIVNLLNQGPLCVCHLQELLDSSQVKISKHLRYMKEKGILHAERHHNWMIYSIPQHPSPELEANLKCLQDCIHTSSIFKKDLRDLGAMQSKIAWLAELPECAPSGQCCGEAKATKH